MSPEIVGRQCQYANDTSDPVIRRDDDGRTTVAAIMLDHKEAHEEARSRDGEQQANPVAGVESGP